MNNMIFIFTLLLVVSCVPTRPEVEQSPSDIGAAGKAFEDAQQELDNEVAVIEVETDLTGVTQEATGEVKAIIPDMDVSEIAKYKTGEPGWIEVSATRIFSNSVAPDKAKQEVLQILRNEAISKKVAASVEVTSLLTDIMSESGSEIREQTVWSGFFRTTVSGVITAEEIIVDHLRPVEGKNSYEKEIILRAYVEPVQGRRDPGFYIDVELENNMLKEGEELAFSIKPSKDCYLYVFNLMADHNIMLMFPNEYMTENYIKADEVVHIPDTAIRNYVKFVVGTMPGETLTTESAYIVCTKEPVRVVRDLLKIGTSIQVFSGESQSFVKLQRWLTNIPLNQRVEKNLIYHVSKK